MTKREMFETIATLNADNAEIVEFCNHEIEHLNARKASKSLTKVQQANIGVLEDIKASLGQFDAPVTVTELISTSPALHGLTNQKVSALLRKLVDEKVVIRTIEGKKALFSLA